MTKYKITLNNTTIEFISSQDAESFVSANGGSIEQIEEIILPISQKEKDMIKFTKRANIKNDILAEIATDNMEKVRTGVWTVSQLISLTQDPQLKDLLDDINTLSFEIAYSKVDLLSHPLLTSEIKNNWKLKLYSNFFNG